MRATVFIPTYNGERYLTELLGSVYSQEVGFEYEVLIIDSGSTDKTLKIVKSFQKKHKNLRLHEIPNFEYGHGKTRNLAANMARGDIVVYLSHDATPSHNGWLYEIVKPFEFNEKIVGVMGKQVPRPWCIPMLKSEINAVFFGFGPDFGTTIFYNDYFVKDQGTYDAVSFYSDVNSAARRSYLTGELPYKDVPYAEDQLLGRDIIDAGYYKVYAPRACVVHSNDLTLKEYKHRMFDETVGLRKIGIPVAVPTKKTITKLIIRGVIRDSINIIYDRAYTLKRKMYWLVVNPIFHIEKWRGVRTASMADLSDQSLLDAYSLENRRKN